MLGLVIQTGEEAPEQSGVAVAKCAVLGATSALGSTVMPSAFTNPSGSVRDRVQMFTKGGAGGEKTQRRNWSGT